MDFNKTSSINHWIKSEASDLFEARFVFARKSYTDKLIAQSEEISDLPTEYVLGQDILEGRIKALDKEIEISEKRKNVLSRLFSGKPKSAWDTDTLKLKREACVKKFEDIKGPISNSDELKEALIGIDSYDSIIKVLRTPELNQIDIKNLLSEDFDLRMFFDDKLVQRLLKAQEKMTRRGRISNVTLPQKVNSDIADQAESDWKVEEKVLNANLKQLESEFEFVRKGEEKEISEIRLEISQAEARLDEVSHENVVDINQVKHLKEKIKDLEYELAKCATEIRNRENQIENIKNTLNDKLNWNARRIAEIQAERDAEEEKQDAKTFFESEDGQKVKKDLRDWMQKQADMPKAVDSKKINKHLNLNSPLVGNLLSRDDKEGLTNILLEAKAIRMDRVKDYYTARYADVMGKFNDLVSIKPPRISDIEKMRIKKQLNNLEIINKPGFYKCGKELILSLDEDISAATEELLAIRERTDFLDDYAKNPEAFKSEILMKVKTLRSKMSEITPSQIDAILAKGERKERARIFSLKPEQKTQDDEFGKSPNYIKEREFFLDLKDPNCPFMKQVAEAEIQTQRIDEMSQEELVKLQSSLEQIYQQVEPINGENIDKALKKADAELAHQAIKKLENVTDVEKIKEILEIHLGSEHFQMVNSNEFEHYVGSDGIEQNLKEYTGGYMVFYERGDEWKIIINEEDILSDGKEFQIQLTHELLHLELENDDEKKADWLKIFTTNPHWENIKQTFFSTFPDKKPPTDKGWMDEDILSEIFAMQNQIFYSDDEKYKNLYNSIVNVAKIDPIDLGLAPASVNEIRNAKSAEEIIDEEKQGKYRGSEGGGGKKGGELTETEVTDSGGSYESYKEDIIKFDGEIKRLLESEYIRFIPGGDEALKTMDDFHKETNDLNEENNAIKSAFIGTIVKDRIDKIKKCLLDMEKNISKVADKMPNTGMSPLRDLWNRSQFYSLEDIFHVGKDIKEWWKRRHERKVSDHAARIGSALFSKFPLPLLKEFGIEAEARELKAEEAEVDEWKKRLHEKDAWDLEHLIHELADSADPNKDMLKGILKALADKGRINWRNPFLWRVLNKLQKETQLEESGGSNPIQDVSLLKNPILLRQKLITAFGSIWNPDFYPEIDRSNGSNYKSGKEKYEGTCEKIADQLTDRLEQLLQKARNKEKVDPQEYEEIIDYCINSGKSTGEAVMFYLIVGVADGILYADRPLALNSKYQNKFPASEWIYNKKPSLIKADYKAYAEDKFKNSYAAGKVDADFKRFYWSVICNDSMVLSRTRKATKERGWDHDWSRHIAPLGDAPSARTFLSGRSGEVAVAPTAVENAFAGSLQWLEENAEALESIDFQKHFARQIAWDAMSIGVVGRVAYLREASTDIYFRGTGSFYSAVAREADVGSHPTLNTRGQINIIQDLLLRVDADLFRMLFDPQYIKGEQFKVLKDYITKKFPALTQSLATAENIDAVYESMDALINAAVYQHSREDFKNIIMSWKASASSKA